MNIKKRMDNLAELAVTKAFDNKDKYQTIVINLTVAKKKD